MGRLAAPAEAIQRDSPVKDHSVASPAPKPNITAEKVTRSASAKISRAICPRVMPTARIVRSSRIPPWTEASKSATMPVAATASDQKGIRAIMPRMSLPWESVPSAISSR